MPLFYAARDRGSRESRILAGADPNGPPAHSAALPEIDMAKGMDQKKDEKKKPSKTMKEKKAEKRDKKAGKAFTPA